MHIDNLLAQLSDDRLHHTLTVPKTWSQGRTLFGGISSALVFQAMRIACDKERLLRAFSCNFVGPLNADIPLDIDVEILRHGKHVSQLSARASQGGHIGILCTAVFAADRPSKVQVPNGEFHRMPLPLKAKFIPPIPKVTPKYLRHLDLAVEQGQMPFTGSKLHHVHGWMRFSDAPERIDQAHVIALADAWPAAPLQMLRWPAPASSISLSMEFIHPQPALKPDSWLGFQETTRQARDGYAHTEATIWHPDGQLLALSRQTVAIFDG